MPKKLTKGQKNAMLFQRLKNANQIIEDKKIEKKKPKDYSKPKVEFEGTETLTEERLNIQKKALERDSKKKQPDPQSIQSLKIKTRLIKGTGKIIVDGKKVKITSKLVRENLPKTKNVKD